MALNERDVTESSPTRINTNFVYAGTGFSGAGSVLTYRAFAADAATAAGSGQRHLGCKQRRVKNIGDAARCAARLAGDAVYDTTWWLLVTFWRVRRRPKHHHYKS